MRNGTKTRYEDFGNTNSAPDVNALRRKMREMYAELSTGSLASISLIFCMQLHVGLESHLTIISSVRYVVNVTWEILT